MVCSGSGTWIRTGDTTGMNRVLWPTELCRRSARIIICTKQYFVNPFFQKIPKFPEKEKNRQCLPGNREFALSVS